MSETEYMVIAIARIGKENKFSNGDFGDINISQEDFFQITREMRFSGEEIFALVKGIEGAVFWYITGPKASIHLQIPTGTGMQGINVGRCADLHSLREKILAAVSVAEEIKNGK